MPRVTLSYPGQAGEPVLGYRLDTYHLGVDEGFTQPLAPGQTIEIEIDEGTELAVCLFEQDDASADLFDGAEDLSE